MCDSVLGPREGLWEAHIKSVVGRRAAVFAAFAAISVIWGTTFLAIRFALMSMPPLAIGGVEYTVAGLLMTGIAFSRRGARIPSAGQLVQAAVAGGLFFALGVGSLFVGMQFIPSGIGALLSATIPLWVFLLSWLLRMDRRPGIMMMLGLFLGLAGVALLVSPDGGGAFAFDPLGAFLALLGSLSWALGTLYAKNLRSCGSVMDTGLQMLFGGLLLSTLAAVSGQFARVDPASISLLSALSFAYLVLFGAIIAFACYSWLLTVANPSKVASYAFINPVVALFVGWAFGGEAVGLRTLAAATIIILGVAMITLAPGRGERKSEARGMIRLKTRRRK